MAAEIKFQDGVIMMAPRSDEQGTKSPSDPAGMHQSLYVCVDGVSEHHDHAKAAGAGDITDAVHMFRATECARRQIRKATTGAAQHVKDIAPEDMEPSFSQVATKRPGIGDKGAGFVSAVTGDACFFYDESGHEDSRCPVACLPCGRARL
jgi:hypothetical protein